MTVTTPVRLELQFCGMLQPCSIIQFLSFQHLKISMQCTATPDEPQYEIKSDKTDHVALHKAAVLRHLN
jgi:hypothetical protein